MAKRPLRADEGVISAKAWSGNAEMEGAHGGYKAKRAYDSTPFSIAGDVRWSLGVSRGDRSPAPRQGDGERRRELDGVNPNCSRDGTRGASQAAYLNKSGRKSVASKDRKRVAGRSCWLPREKLARAAWLPPLHLDPASRCCPAKSVLRPSLEFRINRVARLSRDRAPRA